MTLLPVVDHGHVPEAFVVDLVVGQRRFAGRGQVSQALAALEFVQDVGGGVAQVSGYGPGRQFG